MTEPQMTSLQRVLTALGHREADRVPFFLLLTMHGAKELGLSLRSYFGKAEHVAEGQLRLRARYRHDCLYSFFYAPIEIEAWGGSVIWYDDGPANSGEPMIHAPEQIRSLQPPRVGESASLLRVLRATELMKAQTGDEVPIIGVVMSPFSLPVMQMGFEAYLDLMYGRPDLFDRLMQINQAFCVEWANAQMAAGATAICYFDPVSSPTVIPREMYLKTGFQFARQTLAQIKGPTATHMASGRCLRIVDDLTQTGTAVVGASVLEDLGEVKAACRGKLTVLGNLNGIEMSRWSAREAESAVKEAIAKAGPGGGYILADNHGEIPYQVPDSVLTAISEAVHTWGRYPLERSYQHAR
jgi:uroporphyrinogen decarboxylase